MRQNSVELLVTMGVLLAASLATPVRGETTGSSSKPKPYHCRAADSEPQTVVYDYKTGEISSPTVAVAPSTPVSLVVRNINLFRRKGKITIHQTAFSELIKVPQVISDNLLPKAGAAPAEQATATAMKAAAAGAKNDAMMKKALKHGAAADLQLSNLVAQASAKDAFWTALREFNDATNELDIVESLASRLKQVALDTEDPQAVKRQASAMVNAAFTGASNVLPTDMPGLRAKVLANVESAFSALTAAEIDPAVRGDKDLEGFFKSASDRHDKITKSRSDRDKNFDAAVSLFTTFEQDSFGNEISLPVPSTADDVEIQLDDSLTTEAGGSGDSQPVTIFIIPVVCRQHLTFSTGIFFTGLNSPSFFKNSDMKVAENSRDRFSPALGALVHTPLVFFRNPDLVVPLSFGVALKDSNPIYMLGLSFIIGRSERSVITVGVAGGQVTALSGGVQVGTVIKDAQPATVKVFRADPMIGFTYNFPAAPSSSSN